MNTLPQINQQGNLSIADTTVHMVDGLYSLNDLHKASGGKNKHRPSLFVANQETQALIREVELENSKAGISALAIKTVHGGHHRGTYVCKELVYRYAMWISPKFSLVVIRTFDNLVQQQMTQNYDLTTQITQTSIILRLVDGNLSQAGRYLATHGRYTKPKLKEKLEKLLAEAQLCLPFFEFEGE